MGNSPRERTLQLKKAPPRTLGDRLGKGASKILGFSGGCRGEAGEGGNLPGAEPGGRRGPRPRPEAGRLISIASSPPGGALPRLRAWPPRSAPAAGGAPGSRLPAPAPGSRPRPSLPLAPRPGLGRQTPSAAWAVNERREPPGLAAGDAATRPPGGRSARAAEMYGKEGSAPSLQTCRANHCPPAGPGEAGWALSVALCARVCAEMTKMPQPGDSGPRRSFGPVVCGRWSRWAVVRRGAGALGDSEWLGLPLSWADRGCWWRWSCDSICRNNKSGLCWAVMCGKLGQDCGETLAVCSLRAPRMWEAAPVPSAGEPASSGSLISLPLDQRGRCLPLRPWDPGSLTSSYVSVVLKEGGAAGGCGAAGGSQPPSVCP